MRIAITGASGFLGLEVSKVVRASGLEVISAGGRALGRADVNDGKFWLQQLRGIDAVIHLAARAHILNEHVANPIAEFRRVNVDGTATVAKSAISSGVRRFVFVSSIGVYGDTSDGQPFTEATPTAPCEPYAVSKLEAENVLRGPTVLGKMEVVIVRPPLVYGPNVRGNFLRLLQLVANGLPLPFGSLTGIRSFIGVHNLAELLLLCAKDSRAADQLFVVSDGDDISIPDLLHRLRAAAGRPRRIVRCPVSLLRVAATLAGKQAALAKLSSSLRVDPSKVRATLDWRPSTTLEHGLAEMAWWYERADRRHA